MSRTLRNRISIWTKGRESDLDHESKALQFEVGSEQQTVIALENRCLWHRNQRPNFKTEYRQILSSARPSMQVNTKSSSQHVPKFKKSIILSSSCHWVYSPLIYSIKSFFVIIIFIINQLQNSNSGFH